MTKPQIQAKIVELKADYHQAETKTDLIARMLQLQGTAQPIDKIRRDLAKHGIGDDAATAAIPQQSKRLTRAEMTKAMEKYVAKGMRFYISKDGEQWGMKFKCEQPKQGGGMVEAERTDTGNTMIPLTVLKRCAEVLTTVSLIKRKQKRNEEFAAADFDTVEDDDSVAA